MKKGLILALTIVIVGAGCAFGAYEYAMASSNTSHEHVLSNSNQSTNITKQTNSKESKKVSTKIVNPQPPKALLSQGNKGVTSINGEKFATISVGDGSNQTTAIMPNAGETLNVDKKFSNAVEGSNNTIGTGSAVFNATYNGASGWSISFNGTNYSKASKYTTKYVPKVLEMSSTTGYIYAPASSATNQGFLIGYNLNNKNIFSWIVSINYQNTSLPRKNALGLGNLMLSGNYGLYATNTGAIYTFNDTYTMLVQNNKYPDMRFIFNTGSLNNLEPLQNMGYFNDSFVKLPTMNNNIPVIYPISSSTGYVYQKPTADAKGYIWFFNTNWNHGYSLNANGIAIPAGNYNKPIYNATSGVVNVAASGSIQGVTATPSSDFNGPQVNATSAENGSKALGIEVKTADGQLIAGQAFNVTNSSGTTVATNVQSNSNGVVWLYGLPNDTYTITSVSNPNFTIDETVINGEQAPVANLVYDGTTINAPENLNPTSGTITVDLSQYPACSEVNLYQNGQYLGNYSENSNDQVVISNVSNGLYTVATVINGYVTSTQIEQAINSANENSSTSFYQTNQITTGNIYAQMNEGGSGVHFDLLDSNGNVVASNVTDSSGTVEFSNIPFGNYTVENPGQTQQVSISNDNYTAWAYFS